MQNQGQALLPVILHLPQTVAILIAVNRHRNLVFYLWQEHMAL